MAFWRNRESCLRVDRISSRECLSSEMSCLDRRVSTSRIVVIIAVDWGLRQRLLRWEAEALVCLECGVSPSKTGEEVEDVGCAWEESSWQAFRLCSGPCTVVQAPHPHGPRRSAAEPQLSGCRPRPHEPPYPPVTIRPTIIGRRAHSPL